MPIFYPRFCEGLGTHYLLQGRQPGSVNGTFNQDTIPERESYAANIGSSGLGGAKVPSPDFNVDSFFDITYRVDCDGSTEDPWKFARATTSSRSLQTSLCGTRISTFRR